jgi:hypothetical protein
MSTLPRLSFRLPALILAGLAAALQAAPARPATLAVLPLRGAFQVPKPGGASLPGQRPASGPPQPGPAGARGLTLMETQINQRVTMAFFRTGRFQLIEREQLPAVLKEGAFEHGGLVDDATAAALGKQAGATYVLVGSFTGGIGHTVEIKTGLFGGQTRSDSFPGHLELRLRMVDTESGAIVTEPILVHATSLDPKYYHSYELLLDDLARGLAQETAARYPLTGYVVKVISDREVLVDLGRNQQLEKGASFQLVEQAPDVVHPVTGKLIKGERRVLTTLEATDVGDESSTFRVTGAKAALKAGQTVLQTPQAAPPPR